MTKGKWGESFLKSGLPLEHLTMVTLKTLGWDCFPHVEVARPNRENEETWFELDLEATAPSVKKNTTLSLLIECKYHDMSRFWFFLPHELERWHFDDRVLNCGPIQTLANPRQSTFLSLAPCSSGGIVVSEDGTKQDNAVYAAVQQLVNGFVPHCLSKLFAYYLDASGSFVDEAKFVPSTGAVIPVIVTNASLFRLKPNIADLEDIRKANAPSEIADEIGWTWLYFDVPMDLSLRNVEAIDRQKRSEPDVMYRFPMATRHIESFSDRPNWLAVVNIKSLKDMALSVLDKFLDTDINTVKKILQARLHRRENG